MSAGLHEVIEEGRACTAEQYNEAFSIADRCRNQVNEMFGEFDAIICPSAPGEAPKGSATGSPIFQVTWTLLGVPCLNLPIARGPNNLPLGVQLIGRRHQDKTVMAIGDFLMREFKQIKIDG